MGGSNATLSIVLQLIDDASSALQGVSQNTRQSLQDIQSQADQVRNTFGLMGAAIVGSLGVLVKAAADTDTAQSQLTTAVDAGVTAANADASSTSALATEKKNLQLQLDGVNAKIAEYQQKLTSGTAASGGYADTIATLETKQAGLVSQLDEVNNSLSLVGASTAQIAQQFKAAADANTALGFSVDDSLASFTTLFRATDSVTESMQANQEAMDLARAKGIDLASASTLVIQAMEGNSRALKQFGINLKDGLSPAEALQELQVKLAGSAQDYVNTPWGQMDVATAKTNMLAASLGNELMPVLLNFLQTVTPLIQRVTDLADAHPKLISYILIAVGAFGLLALGIAAVATAISTGISIFLAASTVLAALGSVIAVIGAPVILLGALFVALAYIIVTYHKQIWDEIQYIWGLIKGLWKSVTDWATALFTGWGNVISTWWTSLWNGIYSVLEGIWNKIQAIINSMLSAISKVTGAVSSIAGGIGSAVGGLLSVAVPHFATGGIVSSPTLALVGEAGPEAIIPLSSFAGGSSLGTGGRGGGGGNIIINLAGANISSSSTAMMYANMIAKAVQQQLKVSNFN